MGKTTAEVAQIFSEVTTVVESFIGKQLSHSIMCVLQGRPASHGIIEGRVTNPAKRKSFLCFRVHLPLTS